MARVIGLAETRAVTDRHREAHTKFAPPCRMQPRQVGSIRPVKLTMARGQFCDTTTPEHDFKSNIDLRM
jgi:hypothetical protein